KSNRSKAHAIGLARLYMRRASIPLVGFGSVGSDSLLLIRCKCVRGGYSSRLPAMSECDRQLVRELCSPACLGRRPGTPGGLRARGLVRDALRDAGLDPIEQRISRSAASNLIATMPGDIDRWVLVAAHYDHLGGSAGSAEKSGVFYPGADD